MLVGKQRIPRIATRKLTTKKADEPPQEGGLMKRKLQQLAEEAFPSSADPKAGAIEDALPYNKIDLREKLEKIANNPSNFEFHHQQAIGISKLPSSADRATRDIAMAKPWRGVESNYDLSSRMLNDSIKPLKLKVNKSTPNTIITPPQSIKSRIHDAKEGALEYRLAKVSTGGKNKQDQADEDDGWSEMYRERLLGPSMLLNDSFASVDNSIKSLADQKIMDAQRRGEFKNIKRGKPLEKSYGDAENMFIDRTEYHLNQILKKQDALPPWIEQQGGCSLRVAKFRDELDKEWLLWAINHVKEKYPALSDEELVSKMEGFCHNESSKTGEKLRSKRWLASRKSYFESNIRDLNDTIRGYNLQAPLASQKLYLVLDKELDACYKRVAPLLVDGFKRHLNGTLEQAAQANQTRDIYTHSYDGIPQRENIYQQKNESLFSMFKKLF